MNHQEFKIPDNFIYYCFQNNKRLLSGKHMLSRNYDNEICSPEHANNQGYLSETPVVSTRADNTAPERQFYVQSLFKKE